jgi:hypothetical protein
MKEMTGRERNEGEREDTISERRSEDCDEVAERERKKFP